jgi:hypothetical protein
MAITNAIGRSLGAARGRKRRLLAFGIGLAAAGSFALAQGKPDTVGLKVQSIEVSARPIQSFEKDGGKDGAPRARHGKLEWRGGIVLTSPSSSFGGWSGLALDASGSNLLAISDAGTWMTAEIARNAKDRASGLTQARIGPLKARGSKPLVRERDRDSEALALLEGTPAAGTVLISFEKNNRVGRFALADGEIGAPLDYLKMPPELRRSSGDGIEAVTVLRAGPLKGAVVAFAEHRLRGRPNLTGWIWIGAEPMPFSVTEMGEFQITDVAALADGGLLILERSFTWSEGVKLRLRRLEPAAVTPGAVATGEVLIQADMAYEIDNMEGLAVRDGPDGETLITMISDDNFNVFLQRTVLLEFALAPDASERAEKEEETPKNAAARDP